MNTIKILIARRPQSRYVDPGKSSGPPAAVEHQPGYAVGPRRVFRARNTAPLPGDGVINLARRGPDRAWRYAISIPDN